MIGAVLQVVTWALVLAFVIGVFRKLYERHERR